MPGTRTGGKAGAATSDGKSQAAESGHGGFLSKVDKTSYNVHELKINKKKIGETCVNCSGRNVSRIDAALLMLSAAITWYRICFQFVRFIPFCPYSSYHNLYVDGSSKQGLARPDFDHRDRD